MRFYLYSSASLHDSDVFFVFFFLNHFTWIFFKKNLHYDFEKLLMINSVEGHETNMQVRARVS